MTDKEKRLGIDDEQPTLRMFTLMLSAYGYEILTAENGHEGVEIFRKERPGLVLTDIKMPIMDGIEALKEIKKIDPHAEVIVITGHGDMDLAIQALNLDATDFINKPLQREALEQALSRAAERLAIARNEEGQVALQEQADSAIVSVRGSVTGNTIPHIVEAFASAKELSKKTIILDFDENASINGAGITGLTTLFQNEYNAGMHIRLTGLSTNFKTVFDMVGITKIVDLFDKTEESAQVQ